MTFPDANPQTLATVAALKSECPEAAAAAQIVGCWVWVTFDTKPSPECREYLKGHGFRFNPHRAVWQNACGVKTRRAPYDPRQKYGQVPVAALTDKE